MDSGLVFLPVSSGVCVLFTYAVWYDLQHVLCEQQVGERQQTADLRGKLLQTVFRHIQTHQPPEVPQLLRTRE